MANQYLSLRVNEERFQTAFDELAKIGMTSDGGANRPAFSQEHLRARKWFNEYAGRIGLKAETDDAGNQIAMLMCGRDRDKTLFIGSHLDTVPCGGRFDGALGVTAAFEVAQVIKENNIPIPHNLAVIAFTDEEGRFIDLFGSHAFTGSLDDNLLDQAYESQIFSEAIAQAGLTRNGIRSVKTDLPGVAGYIELHIEQGRRLFEKGIPIGIVTAIVGIRTYKINFVGRADHAGTTAMNERLDALQGACAFALAVRKLVMEDFPGAVATVGNISCEPGASNVVPQSAIVTLEFRADSENVLERLQKALLKKAEVKAKKAGLNIEIENIGRVTSSKMSASVQETISKASKKVGLKHIWLPSWAGHDAQNMSRVCPAGIIFVPSVEGHSHSARELTEWHDCINGANVLLHSILAICGVV